MSTPLPTSRLGPDGPEITRVGATSRTVTEVAYSV